MAQKVAGKHGKLLGRNLPDNPKEEFKGLYQTTQYSWDTK